VYRVGKAACDGNGPVDLLYCLIGRSVLAYLLTGKLIVFIDFYLNHKELIELAETYPENTMLGARGPPGTHDLSLLETKLKRIHSARSPSSQDPIRLPVFDKSKFSGQGDRSTQTVDITSPISVFILEGWSLGYTAQSHTSLPALRSAGRIASTHPLSSIVQINGNLHKFDAVVSPYFDCHIAIRAETYDHVYNWRLQQENMMKAGSGGLGMSDEEVEEFVNKYMPVYEVFGETGPNRRTLRLMFGSEREVMNVEVL